MSLKGPMQWPSLASLCDGYLHQDFAAEHGSASSAVRAWLTDASRDDAVAASSEWRTFLNVTHGMSVEARTHALRDLVGGSWAPGSVEEFDAVSTLLMDAWRQR